MSKWRPTPLNCLYVIPDIHGMLEQLELILKRILPLRKSSGGRDRIIFLGDYIDRRPKSHLVLDLLIDLKKKYKDQVVFLRGNHERMFFDGIQTSVSSNNYLFWMKNGGEQCLAGYLERAGLDVPNPYTFERFRILSIIPKEHIKFINELENYYETEDFIFVHAGCDPNIPLFQQEQEMFYWDRSLHKTIRERLAGVPLPWEKVIVTGHNGDFSGKPYIRQNFMMLDTSARDQIIVVELKSMEAFVAKKGKKSMVKFNLVDNFAY